MSEGYTLPYKVFKKLKEKYTVKTIKVTDKDLSLQGLHLAFPSHRAYVLHKFLKEGVEVTRFHHAYDTLASNNPQLGLVFMVSDSVIDEGMEVHALIGHNAKYVGASNE